MKSKAYDFTLARHLDLIFLNKKLYFCIKKIAMIKDIEK